MKELFCHLSFKEKSPGTEDFAFVVICNVGHNSYTCTLQKKMASADDLVFLYGLLILLSLPDQNLL